MPDTNASSNPRAPVGEGNYVVAHGDCMASIAEAHGHFWEKLWNLPENRTLKNTRKDPNVLLPGDKVTIPDIVIKEVSCATEQKHRFRRKGVPSKLRLTILEFNEPLKNQPFRLILENGSTKKGHTDSEGKLEVAIPPRARRAKLIVGPADRERHYDLDLGGLDPVTTIRGQKQRLNALGFAAGSEDDYSSEEFIEAVRKFLAEAELEVKDELDDAAQDKLEDWYRKSNVGERRG
jgi:hypothetical protein